MVTHAISVVSTSVNSVKRHASTRRLNFTRHRLLLSYRSIYVQAITKICDLHITNGKSYSYIIYQIVPLLMTLSDLGRANFTSERLSTTLTHRLTDAMHNTVSPCTGRGLHKCEITTSSVSARQNDVWLGTAFAARTLS